MEQWVIAAADKQRTRPTDDLADDDDPGLWSAERERAASL
jgi:hypothetical protein